MYRQQGVEWAVDITWPGGGKQADTVFTYTRKQAFGAARKKFQEALMITIKPLDDVPEWERHHYVA